MSLYAEASPIRLPNREVWFVTPHNRFPLLQSPVAACFTPLHLTLGIALGDVRLACSCSAMETYSTKLFPHSFCADINASGSLELFSNGISRTVVTLTYHPPTLWQSDTTLWLYMVFRFMTELLLFLNAPIFQKMPLTVDRGISSRDEIWQTDSLQRWHPVTVPHLWMQTAWLGALLLYTFGLIETPESCN